MKVTKFKRNKSRRYNGMFIYLTRQEALFLMESLLRQINSNNPNTGRVEWMDTPVGYFSVCVDPEVVG